MNKSLVYLALLASGIVLGAVGFGLLSPGGDNSAGESAAEKEPLYWVAPMDPNYRRDKPGKSPMGMDLIPVYEDAGDGGDKDAGTVRVSPDVVNNLGVRTAEVKAGELNAEIKTVGYVQYDENLLVHIHPRVEGWIEKLYVKAAGDPVKKGEPLYAIYSPALVNAQEELLLALNRNNARLIAAADARLRSLQVPEPFIGELKKSRQVAQTVTVYAPQTGVVDNLNVREGFYVMPGTSMLSIGALDEVWVVGEVFERQASLVREGDRVTMTLDYLPDQLWRGTVDYVYPTLNSSTRTARVRMRFSNNLHQLKPNMFAQLVIHSKAADDALVIPREALIRTGDQDRVVLALGGGRFKSVAVKAGRRVDDLVVILDGLVAGDEIVTSAQFLLDSESSRTSDFRRFDHSAKADSPPQLVWVEATVNGLMREQRRINVTHQPIRNWGWPVMTMDFPVAGSVDLSSLKPGMTVQLQVSREQGGDSRVEQIRLVGHDNKPHSTSGEMEQGESHD